MRPKNQTVFLPVLVLPGRRVVEVRLESGTTAADVVEECLRDTAAQPSFEPKDPTDLSPDWWTLVADFKGFEKRFTSEERLYQLVRKHILLAENVDGVRFYLQKKKKRYSVVSPASSRPNLNETQHSDSFARSLLNNEALWTESARVLGVSEGGSEAAEEFQLQLDPPSLSDASLSTSLSVQPLQSATDTLRSHTDTLRSTSTALGSAFSPPGRAGEVGASVGGVGSLPSLDPGGYASDSELVWGRGRRMGNAQAKGSANATVRSQIYASQASQRNSGFGSLPRGATMSGGPSRVYGSHGAFGAAQPAQGANLASLSYGDLVKQAEDQRRRIQANANTIHQKEARLRLLQQHSHGQPPPGRSAQEVQARLRALRAEAASETAELRRLRAAQAQLESARVAESEAEAELSGLQGYFSSKEWELRAAVSRVESLRTQLSELQSRRAAAVAMANHQQRLVTERQRLQARQAELAGVDARLADLRAKADRPKAAVEPFHVQSQPSPGFTQAFNSTGTRDSTDSRRSPPQASQPPPVASRAGLKLPIPSSRPAPARTPSQEDKASPEKTGLGQDIRRKAASLIGKSAKPLGKGPAPQPPKQKAETSPTGGGGSDGGERSSLSSQDSVDRHTTERQASANRRAPVMQTVLEAKASTFPDLIPDPPKAKDSETPAPNSKYAHAEPDMLHIRLDNLRAAKRRSWASSNALEVAAAPGGGEEIAAGGQGSEAEHIRRMLAREQARGKSNINFSWVFDHHEASRERCESAATESASPSSAAPSEEPTLRPPPPYPFHRLPDPTADGPDKTSPPPSPPDHSTSTGKEDSSTTCSPSSSDAEVGASVGASAVRPLKPAPKGILRSRRRQDGARIRFDPLALLLDAALEGELELVKTSARRLAGSVSKANDEGITALHNAICAGHYEIVRFLVEAGGDVNAADSDGWTPLHCAASCNNLPMVKFLVERGSSPFATTLSDHETPKDKCEEDEDGFQGCHNYLVGVLEQMGRVAGGVVYAAYAYRPERPDELSVQEGDRLVVQSRTAESPSETWWECRDAGERVGFLPRNLLGLYPRLAHQTPANAPAASPTTGLGGDAEEMATLPDETSSTPSPTSSEASPNAPPPPPSQLPVPASA